MKVFTIRYGLCILIKRSELCVCDDAYSDTSDNNSSSFDDIHVSALNIPKTKDLNTTEIKQEAKQQKN
jgi:hypothetical protein